ncbi:MAG: hypothetical protein ACMXYA_02000 [Candidatus Woesearchaeota archaeon]
MKPTLEDLIEDDGSQKTVFLDNSILTRYTTEIIDALTVKNNITFYITPTIRKEFEAYEIHTKNRLVKQKENNESTKDTSIQLLKIRYMLKNIPVYHVPRSDRKYANQDFARIFEFLTKLHDSDDSTLTEIEQMAKI